MPLYLFYTTVQKSQKWPKTQIKGGFCLNKKYATSEFNSAESSEIMNSNQRALKVNSSRP